MTGRKRHIVVDTLGLVLAVIVHVANAQDRQGGRALLPQLRGKFPRLKLIFADGGYAGELVQWAKMFGNWALRIVKRTELHKFVVLPKRWIVERTFAWLGRWRRLSKDYEQNPKVSENVIRIAMIGIMLNRLAPRRNRRKQRI